MTPADLRPVVRPRLLPSFAFAISLSARRQSRLATFAAFLVGQGIATGRVNGILLAAGWLPGIGSLSSLCRGIPALKQGIEHFECDTSPQQPSTHGLLGIEA